MAVADNIVIIAAPMGEENVALRRVHAESKFWQGERMQACADGGVEARKGRSAWEAGLGEDREQTCQWG